MKRINNVRLLNVFLERGLLFLLLVLHTIYLSHIVDRWEKLFKY